MQSALDRSMSVGNASREEYVLTKRRVDELQSEVTKLKAQVCIHMSITELPPKHNTYCELQKSVVIWR